MRTNIQSRNSGRLTLLLLLLNTLLPSNSYTPSFSKRPNPTTTMMSHPNTAASALKVAVIGAGAAGLATTRVLTRNGISTTVFEKESNEGGVWQYRRNDRRNPMYRGLRTNLPREIMAFREKPWGSDGKGRSYVTHREVLSYLQRYSEDFNLQKHISYGTNVTQLTVNDDSSITLHYTNDHSANSQNFDAVLICNGHYSSPSAPSIPGIHNFRGRTMHSVEYDDPSVFRGQTVLCIGARASGSDLTREISEFADQVYVSDTSFPKEEDKGGGSRKCGNVIWVPETVKVDDDSVVHFRNCDLKPSTIDVIIFCSGYDYKFPFIHKNSNLNLDAIPGERRVSPLYKQLWHAQHPNIAFIGLQHSVIPFPLFELQAEAVTAQLTNSAPQTLPSIDIRMEEARKDAHEGGPNHPKRVQDTHYLGQHQWDYCRAMAKLAGLDHEAMDDYIATNRAIYDHASKERKSMFPGGPDEYRKTCYIRDDENQSFQTFRYEETTTHLAESVVTSQ